jgi:hypothetical protein
MRLINARLRPRKRDEVMSALRAYPELEKAYRLYQGPASKTTR